MAWATRLFRNSSKTACGVVLRNLRAREARSVKHDVGLYQLNPESAKKVNPIVQFKNPLVDMLFLDADMDA